MVDLEKFKGVIPAFYACYTDTGEISNDRVKKLCDHLYSKGVKGLYIGGSSGECVFQNMEEKMKTLKYVADHVHGKLTLIAHVGAPSTNESIELAKFAEELGYDALSAIPPIYYGLPESAIEKYWTSIMDATALPFFIYNIPQTTGYNLSTSMLETMLENKKIMGVKNSSESALDIERFKAVGGENFIVFNGPDEQYISGRLIGADAGIGGTYGVMPELFLKADAYVSKGRFSEARSIQKDINDIITALSALDGSMHAGLKAVLDLQGVNIGGAREPFEAISEADKRNVAKIKEWIDRANEYYK